MALLLGLTSVLAVGLVLFHIFGETLPAPEDVALWLRTLGFWGPVAVIMLMIVHNFVPFPAEILAVCAGAVFGIFWGSVLIWVGAMLGGLIAFALARWLGQSAVHNWISREQAKTFDRWTEDKAALALLICRFIPVIAFNLINYAAGLTRVRTSTFIWTTGVGILPVTIFSAFLGARMKSFDWGTLLTISVVAIFVVLACHWLAKRHRWI